MEDLVKQQPFRARFRRHKAWITAIQLVTPSFLGRHKLKLYMPNSHRMLPGHDLALGMFGTSLWLPMHWNGAKKERRKIVKMGKMLPLIEKEQAVSSTGLHRIVTGAMVHLIPHNYQEGFGSIKELPGRKRINTRLFISLFSRNTWLSPISCNSQAAHRRHTRQDKPRH